MVELENYWFEEFFDAIYQFIWILDARGKVIKVNQAALDITGVSREAVMGLSLWGIPWPALSRYNKQILKRSVNLVSKGKFVRHELDFSLDGQRELIIDFSFKPILDHARALQFIIVEGRDITRYRRTSEALFQSEARFRTIYEKSGIGILIKDVDGKLLDCNLAFQSMLGYSAAEISETDYLAITYPEDKGISRKLFNDLVTGKTSHYFIEKRYLARDGHIIWARVNTSLVLGSDGQVQFAIAMIENISAHKQIESELMELQRSLMQGREMERLRVAQDLHDGPLQEIIGISYQVQDLANSAPPDADREQLEGIQSALQQLIRSIRSICGELRPPTLIPFGLEKSILSHAEEFRAAHPEMEIELDLAHDGLKLSEQNRIMLYRIYQEAFNNILRHAQASRVCVRFSLDEGQATLEVHDNGVGFELPNRWVKLARQGHLGLVGAMERAKEGGGSLDVTTAPGQGTLIRAVIPLNLEII